MTAHYTYLRFFSSPSNVVVPTSPRRSPRWRTSHKRSMAQHGKLGTFTQLPVMLCLCIDTPYRVRAGICRLASRHPQSRGHPSYYGPDWGIQGRKSCCYLHLLCICVIQNVEERDTIILSFEQDYSRWLYVRLPSRDVQPFCSCRKNIRFAGRLSKYTSELCFLSQVIFIAARSTITCFIKWM